MNVDTCIRPTYNRTDQGSDKFSIEYYIPTMFWALIFSSGARTCYGFMRYGDR